MKKTFRKIVLTGLMTMLGVLPTVAADGIGLTFTRTGTEAADVAVSVVDGGGGLPLLVLQLWCAAIRRLRQRRMP